jgi:hypothetical protein
MAQRILIACAPFCQQIGQGGGRVHQHNSSPCDTPEKVIIPMVKIESQSFPNTWNICDFG